MRFFVALLLAFPVIVFAQDEKELDPVTVTGTIYPGQSSKTGRNIISVKGSDLAKLPFNSIDELLRYIPGVEVQQRGPMGSQSDIVLRGGTFQQVLVLIDGVRVNDPNTGHFSSYIPIAPAEIERVEILKGPASAMYGSEAVGGVVHIITKTFSRDQQKKDLQLQAKGTIGDFNLLALQAGGFYQKNKTAVSGGINIIDTKGQPQRGTKGFVHNKTISLSANHVFNDSWSFSLRGTWDSRDFSAQNFYTTFASDTASEMVETTWSQARLSFVSGDHKLHLSSGYKSVKDHYLFASTFAPNDNKSRLLQHLLTDEWKIGNQSTLVSGVQAIHKIIRSNDRGDHDLWQGAAFINLQQSFADKFYISPALRMEWHEVSGADLVPQLSLAYKLKHLHLRATAGKTIRDADFTERFNNYNKPLVPRGSIGNPDLEAERSFSYEAGADYLAAKSFKVSATLFNRHHRHLVDWVNTPYNEMPRKENLSPTGTYALAKNIDTVNTRGLELDVQYRYRIEKGQLLLGAGLLWMKSSSSGAAPSFYVSSHARVLTNFFAEFSYGRFAINCTGLFKERRAQQANAIHATVSKNYFVLNTKVSFALLKQQLNCFIQADNVFDKQYSDILGTPMPGRWVMGGLQFDFGK